MDFSHIEYREISLNFLLLLDIAPIKKSSSLVPLLIPDHISGKKVSLIDFRQILPEILPVMCIFSYTIMTYLKNLEGTKSLNTKQFPAGLSPRIMHQVSPFLPKCPLLWWCSVALTRCRLSPLLSLSLYGKIWGWGKILPNSQKFTHFPTRKIFLHRLIYIFHYQKYHSSLIKQQFSCNHPMQALFVSAVISVVSFFNVRLYIHIFHANFD